MNTKSVSDRNVAFSWAGDSPQVKAFDVYGRQPSGITHCFNEVLQNHSTTLFIKLDDDIVLIERHALAHLAAHKLFHPSASFRKYGVASANVINHGHLAFVHEALGAWTPAGHSKPDYYSFWGQPGTWLLRHGIRQHEDFLRHVAEGTTDAYHFGVWDMNQCSCDGRLHDKGGSHCLGGHHYRYTRVGA